MKWKEASSIFVAEINVSNAHYIRESALWEEWNIHTDFDSKIVTGCQFALHCKYFSTHFFEWQWYISVSSLRVMSAVDESALPMTVVYWNIDIKSSWQDFAEKPFWTILGFIV